CKRVGFVSNAIDVPLQVQECQFPPGTLGEKIGFPLIESELLKSLPAVEIFLGEPLAPQEAHHVISPRMSDWREGELLQVTPTLCISGVVEMYNAEICVQTIREGIMRGPDM